MQLRKARRELEVQANVLGLSVDFYSPGDGVTRYRFFAGSGHDYFESGGLYTAFGIAEAITWLTGYSQGKEGAS